MGRSRFRKNSCVSLSRYGRCPNKVGSNSGVSRRRDGWSSSLVISWNQVAIPRRYLRCCSGVCQLGLRSRKSSSQFKSLLCISRTTVGNSCRVLLSRRSRRRRESAQIPTRSLSSDDQESVLKNSDSTRCPLGYTGISFLLSSVATTQYLSLSLFFLPRTRSVISVLLLHLKDPASGGSLVSAAQTDRPLLPCQVFPVAISTFAASKASKIVIVREFPM